MHFVSSSAELRLHFDVIFVLAFPLLRFLKYRLKTDLKFQLAVILLFFLSLFYFLLDELSVELDVRTQNFFLL